MITAQETSNINVTISGDSDERNNISKKINLNTTHYKDIELILEATKNHKVKGGHGITDYLPGIRANRYGFVQ